MLRKTNILIRFFLAVRIIMPIFATEILKTSLPNA